MSESQPADASQKPLDQIIAEYLAAEQSGNPPDRNQLLAEYAELADELRTFFADHDSMPKMAEPLDAADDKNLESDPNAATVLHTKDQTDLDSATLSPIEPRNAADISEESPPGTTSVRYFGDYELLAEIARGGMGIVYKARQVSLNRVVALKMILAGQLASEQDVHRFQMEAEAAANLDHPGIVPIFEVGEHEGQHYFSMGFVDADSLSNKLSAGALPRLEAANITKRVAEAIAYAHEQGVIHRDLKPANILLEADGQPKVTDFGLAKKVEVDSGLTATGQVLGTPGFMPPEQASGDTETGRAVGRRLLVGRDLVQPADRATAVPSGQCHGHSHASARAGADPTAAIECPRRP